MPVITLEEHFVTQSFLDAVKAVSGDMAPAMRPVQEKLLDLGEVRLAEMDKGQVDIQVLSLAANGLDKIPGETETPLCRDINDELAAAIAKSRNRLAGFATLPVREPETAAKELERCVREHSFVGGLMDGTCQGKFMDQPEFYPIFEAAESLGVPIYLHPAFPPDTVKNAYFSDLPGDTGLLLSIAGWGWHAETGLHILRLIVAGIFERFPKLQIIIGHMGEGVPYALARSNNVLSRGAKLPLSVAEYFLRNVHVTTSGYFTKPPFDCALAVLGIDRLMYSIDYPFSSTEQGRDFLSSLGLSEENLRKLSYENAARLLKLGE